MNFLSSLFSTDSEPVTFLKTQIEECKGSISKGNYETLQKGCKQFTADTLQNIDKEVVNVWMVLFQLHSDRISTKELREAIKAYESVFDQKSVSILFLNELITPCEQQVMKNEFSLLKKVCKLFHKDAISVVDKRILLRWTALFEAYEELLDRKEVGQAFANYHTTRIFKPKRLHKQINVCCLDGKETELPLALLLTYRTFQQTLTSNTFFLPWEGTAITVVEAFQKYLYEGSEPLFSDPFLLIQLLDIARWIKDERLIKLCLNKLPSIGNVKYLKESSEIALKGDKEEDLENAKQFFITALQMRTSDSLSCAALGLIALQEKQNKTAMGYFEKASSHASFGHLFVVYHIEASLDYIQELRSKISGFLDTIFIFSRKTFFGECIKDEMKKFLRHLQKYQEKDSLLAQEMSLTNNIAAWKKLVAQNSFKSHHIEKIEQELSTIFTNIKKSVLSKAEQLLQTIPIDYAKGKELYLQGELQYEKGAIAEAEKSFLSLKTLALQNEMLLTNKEKARLHYNLSKVYAADGRIDEAKIALSDALFEDCEDSIVLRSCILLDEKQALWYAPDFLKTNSRDTEVHKAYAFALLNQEKPKEAKEHLLQANCYQASTNYYLGTLDEEKKSEYFKKALLLAVMDKLSFDKCVEIANYFLTFGGIQEWESLTTLFSQFNGEYTKQKDEILFRLSRKTVKQPITFTPTNTNELSEKMEKLSLKETSQEIKASDETLSNAISLLKNDGEQPHLRKTSSSGLRKELSRKISKVTEKTPPSLNKLANQAENLSDALTKLSEPQGLTRANSRAILRSESKKVSREVAKQELSESLKKNLQCVDLLFKKMEVSQSHDKALLKAKTILKTLKNEYPDNTKITLLLGKCYLEDSKCAKANNLFTHVLEKGPRDTHSEALSLYGNSLFKEGNLKEAEQKFKKALELDQSSAEAYMGLLQIALKRADKDAIQKILGQIKEKAPQFLDTLVYTIPTLVTYLTTSQANGLRPFFENKIKEEKATLLSYYCLAKICLQQKDKEAANTYFKKVIEWEHPQDILKSWHEFLDVGFCALEQNNIASAQHIAMILLEHSKSLQNPTEMQASFIALWNSMAETASKQKKSDALADLLPAILEFLQNSDHLGQECTEQIKRVSVAIICALHKKEKEKQSSYTMELIEYLAGQEGGFSFLHDQKEVAKTLMEIVQKAGKSLKTTERDKVKLYQEIIKKLKEIH